MISVFAGFALADDTTIKSMGFALAVGVLFDAFAIRMAAVPAVMSLLGEKAWWIPRWLDRALPDIDGDGEQLTRVLARTTPLPPRPAEPQPLGSATDRRTTDGTGADHDLDAVH
jgi:putative drug exporter of the RND superfamily